MKLNTGQKTKQIHGRI